VPDLRIKLDNAASQQLPLNGPALDALHLLRRLDAQERRGEDVVCGLEMRRTKFVDGHLTADSRDE
jgi:hypothetical protein